MDAGESYIWETFNSLFVAVHKQGRRIEELEERIADLEKKLNARLRIVGEDCDGRGAR